MKTKNLKKLNKDLQKALVEFRKYSTENGAMTKKRGFFKNIFS
ncbi:MULTISPECIES: hypothetical protein [unclassified Flavobacterium]|nr:MULTISPECIES: hypothetical protein [unclassified Flavobacterium]|tara:strand:+ start:792 stop:920 length:129 start_codon:yes stop_codon:yes gene_type:complete